MLDCKKHRQRLSQSAGVSVCFQRNVRCRENPSVHALIQGAEILPMDGTVMSTDKPPRTSTIGTFVTLIQTNDMVARGRNSARDFFYCILCVSSATVKADSLPPRKYIISCRWQTVVRMKKETLWRYVRAAIRKLRSEPPTRVRIHTRNDPVGVILPL